MTNVNPFADLDSPFTQPDSVEPEGTEQADQDVTPATDGHEDAEAEQAEAEAPTVSEDSTGVEL